VFCTAPDNRLSGRLDHNVLLQGSMMIKYLYPDGSHCYRAVHTAHAVFRNADGKLIARAEKADRSGMYEFEIAGFELLSPGIVYD
tara:strand:- start:41 stop:295 length:255 start_codon:yes stop_codon:yes gene_type:complete